jgi:ParB family chromosome partitioning protein
MIGSDSGESREQVRRYIRLTNLIPEILQYVDEGRISFTPAVELSYLTVEEQHALFEQMEMQDCTPSLSQACRLKKLSREEGLSAKIIEVIMSEEKANQKERLKIPLERIRKFFPKNYTVPQMEDEIVKMCEARFRSRNRDAR